MNSSPLCNIKKPTIISYPYLCIVVLFSIFFSLITTQSIAQKTKQIELLGANTFEYDERFGGETKKLIGNVSFKHENAFMYCDSAYLYPNNSLDAFGNVHIQQGDSLNLYGKKLKYNGNTKKAEITESVQLNDKKLTLTTDALQYDLKNKVANYSTGGTITSGNNILTSQQGYYHSSTQDFFFKNKVLLVNPEYTMLCDTLKYNTASEIAYFFGPTRITSEENLIYCENGWYDTQKDISQFSKNAYLLTKDQKLKGDSLYYDRKKGYGKASQNIEITDSASNILIKGDLAQYFQPQENSIVTGRALFVQANEKDTLFLHADTLQTTYDTTYFRLKAFMPVSEDVSRNHRLILAYHKVKFFREDIQGKCDSLTYTYSDSTMQLFKDPILWSDENQLTGEHMNLKTYNGNINYLLITNAAFIASQQDSLRYNQVKGKSIKGFFYQNVLRKVNVNGNGQSIYYVKEEDKGYIGVNKVECSDIIIYMKEKKQEIEKIIFINQPDATFYPLGELSSKELLLKDFKWYGQQRPLSQKDVFLW